MWFGFFSFTLKLGVTYLLSQQSEGGSKRNCRVSKPAEYCLKQQQKQNPGVVESTCHPNTWKMEAAGSPWAPSQANHRARLYRRGCKAITTLSSLARCSLPGPKIQGLKLSKRTKDSLGYLRRSIKKATCRCTHPTNTNPSAHEQTLMDFHSSQGLIFVFNPALWEQQWVLIYLFVCLFVVFFHFSKKRAKVGNQIPRARAMTGNTSSLEMLVRHPLG